ncbi:hypothetical protein ABZ352_18920 [Streptomyces griseofuscus]|uniref:hypothetical protein n=1 Tax=Streptomyces griseofuscus TaxID=146922 RepID=UPI00340F9230
MRTPYAEVAAAPGAWTHPLRLPPDRFQRVQQALTELARTGRPVAAFLLGGEGEPVTDVELYRDPSRTFGTPDIAACEEAVRALSAATGWPAAPRPEADSGLLVGLGLREGYAPGAREHAPEETADHLRALSATGWECRTARLVSARLVGGAVRWYDEVGVVIRAEARLLPAIEAAACAFAQHRFTVTDLGHRRTYVLQQRDGE